MKTKFQIIKEKRADYTRKRRKKYILAKNIRKNKPYKPKKKTEKPTQDIISKSSIINPEAKKISWWRRLINFLLISIKKWHTREHIEK